MVGLAILLPVGRVAILVLLVVMEELFMILVEAEREGILVLLVVMEDIEVKMQVELLVK